MRSAFLAGATAVVVLVGSQATAQTTTTGAESATLAIDSAQRTKIKEYLVAKKVQPVTLKDKLTVGAFLPADVVLLAVPMDWGPELVNYRYVYSDNQVAFVEGGTGKVVQIID